MKRNRIVTALMLLGMALFSWRPGYAQQTINGAIVRTGTLPVSAINASGTASSATYLRGDGSWSGTVTSVSLALPSIFTVSGSPVTSSGTLTGSYATGLTSNEFQVLGVNGSGAAGLYALTASYLPLIPLTSGVSGILPVANGGTGISTTPSNGQIPIGNGTNYTAATITAGTNVTITNGSGSITINASGGGSYTGTAPIVVSGSTISVNNATTSAVGVSQLETSSSDTTSTHVVTANDSRLLTADGTTITNSGGTISAATATTSAKGIVKPDGSSITISSGTISVPTATTSALGLVKPDGSSITISSGTISASNGVGQSWTEIIGGGTYSLTTSYAEVAFNGSNFAATLPASGTYEVKAVLTYENAISASGMPQIYAKLTDTTSNIDLAYSQTKIQQYASTSATTSAGGEIVLDTTHSFSGADTVAVYIYNANSASGDLRGVRCHLFLVPLASTSQTQLAFNPSSISGLVLWLKADAGTSTTTGGTKISSWNDQSGNSNNAAQATSANQPVYTANVGPGGLPGITFTAANSTCLTISDASSLRPTSITIFAVYKIASPNSFAKIIARNYYNTYSSTSPYDSWDLGCTNNSVNDPIVNIATSSSAFLQTYSTSATTTSGTLYEVDGNYGSPSGNVYINNASAASGSQSGGIAYNTTGQVIVVGSTGASGGVGASGNFFDGALCELLVYNSVLSSTNLANVRYYLADKWGTF